MSVEAASRFGPMGIAPDGMCYLRLPWAPMIGPAITEAACRLVVVMCGRERVDGCHVTLCAEFMRIYESEPAVLADLSWPTMWGFLPVYPGEIDALWVPGEWMRRVSRGWSGLHR